MGQYANQPDFATRAVGPITPDVNINQTTFLDSAAIYVGNGGNLKVIMAGTVGASTINGFSSPGYSGSGGTGYAAANNVATTTTGAGTNLTVNTTVIDGVVTSIVIGNNAGTGYLNGDLITVTGGGANAVFRVEAVPGPPTATEAVEFINIQDGSFVPVIVDYVLPATATAASNLVAVY
jgi:hypothetical protein